MPSTSVATHRHLNVVAAVLLLLHLLPGVFPTQANSGTASAASSESFSAVLVLPDDGAAPFLDELEAAEDSIRLYIYLLSDEEIIAALLRARLRGVEVRVMLDPTPYGGAGTELEVYERLKAGGIDVRWTSEAFRFAHVKMLIVDEAVLLIMNLNFTETAFLSNREFAVITDDPARLSQALAIFENDWHGRRETTQGPLVVSPESSRGDLLQLITSAEYTIDIYAEVLTDQDVVNALVAAVSRGVRVRLLMSEASDGSLWDEAPGYLAQRGADVRIAANLYIHAKAIVVDESLAWIGSQNFTANSLDNNREVGTFVDDQAGLARIMTAFETDVSQATVLAPP